MSALITVDLSSSSAAGFMAPELIAGLGGTVVGGLISLATSYYFYLRQRKDERLASAISLTTKVHKIADDVHKAKLLIDGALSGAEQLPLWSKLRPMVGFGRDKISFETAEVAIFALSGDAAFVQDLYEAASFHGLLLELIHEFSQRREQVGSLLSELGHVVPLENNLRVTTVDERGKAIIDPIIANLTSLAESLVDMCRKGQPRITAIANSVCNRTRAALKDGRFNLELAFGNAASVDVRTTGQELSQ